MTRQPACKPTFSALCAAALLVVGACSESSDEVQQPPNPGPPPPPPPPTTTCSPSQQNSSNYFSRAIDEDLFFRFTRFPGKSYIMFLIEVHDQASAVPSGFDRSDRQRDISSARSHWKSAIQAAGIGIESSTRFLSVDAPHSDSRCKILVKYVDSVDELGGAAGTTRHSRSGSSMQEIEVRLALRDSSGNPFSNAALRQVAIHEFGHALGIAGFAGGASHSSHKGDVMYPTNVCDWQQPSTGDEATVRTLYQKTPSITPKGY